MEVDDDFGSDEWIANNGWYLSQTFGDINGVHLCMYERNCSISDLDNPEVNWLIAFSTAAYWHPILVRSWVDLIELLAKLSPIALAGCIKEGGLGGFFPTKDIRVEEEEYERRCQINRRRSEKKP